MSSTLISKNYKEKSIQFTKIRMNSNWLSVTLRPPMHPPTLRMNSSWWTSFPSTTRQRICAIPNTSTIRCCYGTAVDSPISWASSVRAFVSLLLKLQSLATCSERESTSQICHPNRPTTVSPPAKIVLVYFCSVRWHWAAWMRSSLLITMLPTCLLVSIRQREWEGLPLILTMLWS